MPRTLLFYTHAHGGGGAEITFDRLARALAAGGDRVIFAADHPAAGRMDTTHPADGVTRMVLGRRHLRSIFRLAALLRRERPDATFSALGAQNLKHLAAALLAGRRRLCVLGVHGFAEAEPRPFARLFYALAPLATRLAAATVCVSDALMAEMSGLHGARRLRRIHNAVPDALPRSPRARDPHLILALGRLEPVKRFPDLVAALARLPPNTHLVILGEGSQRAAIDASARRHGVAHRVVLPGFVADPSPWYARAACLAIASSSESFGLTAAEALAHGLFVVTTDCGGPPEVLAGCGAVVPVGDVDALAQALAAALVDPGDPAPRLARAASFSIAGAAAAYAALADEVAGGVRIR